MELHGQVLCEDCCMDLLSPAKACDPWAVHSAKRFMERAGKEVELSPVQERILEILQHEGPQQLAELCEKLQAKQSDLERDLAALRHMEKIGGEMKEEKKLICLW